MGHWTELVGKLKADSQIHNNIPVTCHVCIMYVRLTVHVHVHVHVNVPNESLITCTVRVHT